MEKMNFLGFLNICGMIKRWPVFNVHYEYLWHWVTLCALMVSDFIQWTLLNALGRCKDSVARSESNTRHIPTSSQYHGAVSSQRKQHNRSSPTETNTRGQDDWVSQLQASAWAVGHFGCGVCHRSVGYAFCSAQCFWNSSICKEVSDAAGTGLPAAVPVRPSIITFRHGWFTVAVLFSDVVCMKLQALYLWNSLFVFNLCLRVCFSALVLKIKHIKLKSLFFVLCKILIVLVL